MNVGLETAFRVMGVWWNPLGEKGKQHQHPVALRTSWNREEWPQLLDGLHLKLQQLLGYWLWTGQGWGTGGWGWFRSIKQHFQLPLTFSLLPWTPTQHVHRTKVKRTHHVKTITTWTDVRISQILLWHLPSHFCKAVHSFEFKVQSGSCKGFALLEAGEVCFYWF